MLNTMHWVEGTFSYGFHPHVMLISFYVVVAHGARVLTSIKNLKIHTLDI